MSLYGELGIKDPSFHTDFKNVNLFLVKSVPKKQGFGSGSVSGSVLDPYSIGPLDPDPEFEYGSGSGSRRAKMTHKSRKNSCFEVFWMASFVSWRLLL